MIALGIVRRWPETVYLSTGALVVYLVAKYSDWWWDALPRWLFFLLLGLFALALLWVFRRLRVRLAGIAMSRRLPLWAGLAVILAVSAGTLLGVLWNRTGTPDAVLELEERELIVLPAEREDSGRTMTWIVDGARAPGCTPTRAGWTARSSAHWDST